MVMDKAQQFFINGEWVDPISGKLADVINPATEESFLKVALGGKEDIDRAVAAAKAAFDSFSQTTKEQRLELLRNMVPLWDERFEELAQALSREVGAPITVARQPQTTIGRRHLIATIEALEKYEFEYDHENGGTRVFKEAAGVAGLISPWNWPYNQLTCKVFPVIAAGCTMVIKPSELTPVTAILFTQLMHDAGVPAGVINLVQGTGPVAGAHLASHPDVDLVSFTGSGRAGAEVAKAGADTIKRVLQELGGKSPNIILEDADLETAVTNGTRKMFMNSGQNCDAPSRMIVPAHLQDKVTEIAARVVSEQVVGDTTSEETTVGPVASEQQYNRVQSFIQLGLDEGATLVAGGLGKPEGCEIGYFVKPTVFADVKTDMRIAQEEIFGPVLCIMPYSDVEEAITIANDSIYGLAGYIQTTDQTRAREIARRLRTGMIIINTALWDPHAPFGGYKQSGNGREHGVFAIEDFVEIKGITGY